VHFIHEFSPIPERFWSFETGQPFDTCKMCGTGLLGTDTNYLIEKALKDGEVLFEYAVCLDCQRRMQQELSTESLQRIQGYFERQVDLEVRRHQLLAQYGMDCDGWLEQCMVKGFPVRECHEVQIYAHCVGEQLAYAGMPYALCGEVMEEVIELLSPESLGALELLSDELLGLDYPKGFLVF
jgi:hypothetical protein